MNERMAQKVLISVFLYMPDKSLGIFAQFLCCEVLSFFATYASHELSESTFVLVGVSQYSDILSFTSETCIYLCS